MWQDTFKKILVRKKCFIPVSERLSWVLHFFTFDGAQYWMQSFHQRSCVCQSVCSLTGFWHSYILLYFFVSPHLWWFLRHPVYVLNLSCYNAFLGRNWNCWRIVSTLSVTAWWSAGSKTRRIARTSRWSGRNCVLWERACECCLC